MFFQAFKVKVSGLSITLPESYDIIIFKVCWSTPKKSIKLPIDNNPWRIFKWINLQLIL